MNVRTRIAAALLVALAALSSGCAASLHTVKPWDRDLLAQKKMKLVPSDREAAVDQHVYFSKEGSTGGTGVGGGGCGCN
jgi:hypothetical protein